MRRFDTINFPLFLLLVSLAFAWIILPFSGAILWAVVAAIMFAPVNDRLLRHMPTKHNLAALLTLLVIMAIVIIPALMLAAVLMREAIGAYAQVQSGQFNLEAYFVAFQNRLPHWLSALTAQLGLSDLEAVRQKLAAGANASLRTLAGRAFSIGQSAFGFFVALSVMLYLTFFLLRDGRALAVRTEGAIPLEPEQRNALLAKFVAVIRATVKGSLVVAVIQGAIGGIVFWFLGLHGALLWGTAMGFMSLFPAIGTGIVWVPVAIYLLATGAIWQGVVLVLCGLFVIGMVDNILRPILVGRDARMPDYVVLVSTLGGLELIGFNGLLIGPLIAALFIAAWDIFRPVGPQKAADAGAEKR